MRGGTGAAHVRDGVGVAQRQCGRWRRRWHGEMAWARQVGETAQGRDGPGGRRGGGGTVRWCERDGMRWETVQARSRWHTVGDSGAGRGKSLTFEL